MKKREFPPKGAEKAEKKAKEPLVRGRTAADDVDAVIAQYGLPKEFPKEVRREARRIAAAGAVYFDRRLDLRKRYVFTCDPATAKDFDDALSVERGPGGGLTLGVHIADVSHYVRPGTVLDVEAFRRSTSVYLLDRVVPMLPEELSNGVCSLVPGEDRLAFSAFLTFDRSGRCVARRFAKSIIRSKDRFTYEQVLSVIRRGRGASQGDRAILAISDLAQRLRARRFADGALDLEVPETEILLDAQGRMTGLETRPYDEAHQMVEECMVAANEAVARELWTRGVHVLARLHERPDPERLEQLRADLASIGVKCGDLSHGRNVASFLSRIKGDPLEGTIAVMVLRSMKRACYDAGQMGHFGLAKDFYSHFTSPIRRYPDLVLHRQLADFLETGSGRLPQQVLDRAAKHCSELEERADEAERTLKDVKKYRFVEENGGEFDATVSRVMPFGVFVDVPALATGGLVPISALSDRFVRFDEGRMALGDGEREWRIGGRLRVRATKVDWKNHWIDFAAVGGVCQARGRGRRRSGEGRPEGGESRRRRKRGRR